MSIEKTAPADFPFKAEWIAALRSGKYKQARGKLKKDGGYCCLGVYCEIAGLPIDSFQEYIIEVPVCNYEPIEQVIGKEFTDRCIDLNDSLRCSFDDIADYVEGTRSFQFFASRARDRQAWRLLAALAPGRHQRADPAEGWSLRGQFATLRNPAASNDQHQTELR